MNQARIRREQTAHVWDRSKRRACKFQLPLRRPQVLLYTHSICGAVYAYSPSFTKATLAFQTLVCAHACKILLDTKRDLQPLINIKARGHHRHNLDIPNTQANIKALETSFAHDIPRNLWNRQSMPIAHDTTNLHPSPYHFKWVRERLRYEASHGACREFRPCAQRRWFAGCELFC